MKRAKMKKEQQTCIANYEYDGYKQIIEARSPIVFNIQNPVYLKKENKYVVIDSAGHTISWDHGNPVSRNLVLVGDERAILNPGDDPDLDI